MSNEDPVKIDGRGGYRPGAGRKPVGDASSKFQLHLGKAEQEQIRALGGTKWVRALILKALADAKH